MTSRTTSYPPRVILVPSDHLGRIPLITIIVSSLVTSSALWPRFARLCGIPLRRLRLILAGRAVPDLYEAEGLARALRLPLSRLPSLLRALAPSARGPRLPPPLGHRVLQGEPEFQAGDDPANPEGLAPTPSEPED